MDQQRIHSLIRSLALEIELGESSDLIEAVRILGETQQQLDEILLPLIPFLTGRYLVAAQEKFGLEPDELAAMTGLPLERVLAVLAPHR
ncbi:hypothetical protein GIS00_06275 [Nakamurella sp. YIM 132087]|uniref:Uncharacterized protein n=1 Tax=Nakamurella alba TaxID=2665158 RepID=A0A7K1FHJ7_9ACTN|nr:hypothetical protein [Nakamurella alba]MTD13550.1 hypothetical protein [Nakamurella alba]